MILKMNKAKKDKMCKVQAKLLDNIKERRLSPIVELIINISVFW